MTEVLTPDICVIGAGAGGPSVAAAAAAFGVPTVLIEGIRMGDAGTMPSKALLAAAAHAASARAGQPFGVKASVGVDFGAVQKHVRDTIARIAPLHSAEHLTGLGVRVIKGEAVFKDRCTIVVDDRIEIRARRFVLATGSRPAVPDVPGLDTGPYYTTESIFDLKQLPARLIVAGAGAVDLELAQALRRLGSDVTVLEAGEPLAGDDPEAGAIVLAQLERDGIIIKTNAKLVHISHSTYSVAVTIESDGRQEMVEGSHLLIAVGRKPATDALNLTAARIKHDVSGIKVNRKLKTSNRRVYAIGDAAAGQPRDTQAADYHVRLVILNALFRAPVRADPSAVPRVTFTDPELAQAGLTEAEARARRLKFGILRWPYHDNDRAQAERSTHGHIKVIVDKKGRVLGATIVGARAGEMIATWSLAVAQRLNIRAFADVVFPHPTYSEIGKRVAVDFFAPNLTRPWVRRIIGWLRILG